MNSRIAREALYNNVYIFVFVVSFEVVSFSQSLVCEWWYSGPVRPVWHYCMANNRDRDWSTRMVRELRTRLYTFYTKTVSPTRPRILSRWFGKLVALKRPIVFAHLRYDWFRPSLFAVPGSLRGRAFNKRSRWYVAVVFLVKDRNAKDAAIYRCILSVHYAPYLP